MRSSMALAYAQAFARATVDERVGMAAKVVLSITEMVLRKPAEEACSLLGLSAVMYRHAYQAIGVAASFGAVAQEYGAVKDAMNEIREKRGLEPIP